MLCCKYRKGGDIDNFNIWEIVMKNEEKRMTEAIRRLLEKKRVHLEEMKDAGRIVEIFLVRVEINKVLTYGGL